MINIPIMTMRRISYIRKVPGWHPCRQRESVGVTVAEYSEPTPETAIASMRDGDELVVASARVLADNRDAIAYAIQAVHERNGTLMEADTKRDSREHGAGIMADAVAALANEARATGRRNGQKGASVRWGKIKRMNKREALVIWRDPANTTDEAIGKMDGWTKATAYRVFGERGIPAGRR